MTYRGDIALGSTLDIKFCTVSTTGAPTTLSGVPVISVYVDNSLTQFTTGVTLSVDFDGVTGLNNVRVVASGGNGFASGSNYQLVITTGTVGGTSVVGYVVAEFSIEARSALRPATAGRTLVVDAAGLGDANMVKAGPTGAGTAQTARDLGASVIAASVTGNVGGNVVGSVASVAAPVVVGSTSVGALDVASFTSAAEQAFADQLLNRDMSTGTDSGTELIRTPRQALRVLRNKVDIPNGKVKKEDDTTDSWTFATTTAAGNPVTVVDPT